MRDFINKTMYTTIIGTPEFITCNLALQKKLNK